LRLAAQKQSVSFDLAQDKKAKNSLEERTDCEHSTHKINYTEKEALCKFKI